jgi:hypothetical protein
MWRVTLTCWTQIPGIFVWIILSGIQAAPDSRHGRFLKSVFKVSCSQIAQYYWDFVDTVLMGYVRLQRWLRGRRLEAVERGEE